MALIFPKASAGKRFCWYKNKSICEEQEEENLKLDLDYEIRNVNLLDKDFYAYLSESTHHPKHMIIPSEFYTNILI